MDKPELKPCPFCGEEAIIKKTRDAYSVCCIGSKCKVAAFTDWFATKEEAAAAWNRRAEILF